MIYINSNTTRIDIPKITSGVGNIFILINQITHQEYILPITTGLDGYIVDFTDYIQYLVTGQYDYIIKKDEYPLESGIIQFGDYILKNNQYNVECNIIQYELDDVYTPIPDNVLDIVENGVYEVEDYDKVNVDVVDDESAIIIEQLENRIDTLEDEISTLEGTVDGLESEVNRLDDLKDSLQSQIDSVTTLSVTENGTYIPEEGTLGWDEVSVNVPQNTKVVLGNDIKFGYSKFEEVPDYFDFSQTTDFSYAFYFCSNLTTIPQLDTGNCVIFSDMFRGCSSLTSIPQLDTSNGTNFNYMFSNCSHLTSIPQLDTSNGTNFGDMFSSCSRLTSIPQLDTSNGTNFSYMFHHCLNLEEISGELDVSKANNNYSLNSMFGNIYAPVTKLTKVLFKEFINYNIDFSSCTSLSYDSVKSILTACSNTTNTNAKTLKFNITLTDQNGELQSLVDICTSKGWTISGLTLN